MTALILLILLALAGLGITIAGIVYYFKNKLTRNSIEELLK